MVIMKNAVFTNNGTGISVSSGSKLEIDGIVMQGNDVGYFERPDPSFFAQLGLPADTSPQIVLEALRILKRSESLPLDSRLAELRETRLVNLVGAGANLMTIYTTLLPLVATVLA